MRLDHLDGGHPDDSITGSRRKTYPNTQWHHTDASYLCLHSDVHYLIAPQASAEIPDRPDFAISCLRHVCPAVFRVEHQLYWHIGKISRVDGGDDGRLDH